MPRTAVLRSAQVGPGASPGRPTPAQRSSMPPPRAIVRATPHAPVQCPGHLDGSAQSWYSIRVCHLYMTFGCK
uniref:Uncharacterized protein n=1 Tax=Zea mays TaxID=4577 RepID=B6U2Q8_MAIZE|nr:hypothetical protein [Zea mays]